MLSHAHLRSPRPPVSLPRAHRWANKVEVTTDDMRTWLRDDKLGKKVWVAMMRLAGINSKAYNPDFQIEHIDCAQWLGANHVNNYMILHFSLNGSPEFQDAAGHIKYGALTGHIWRYVRTFGNWSKSVAVPNEPRSKYRDWLGTFAIGSKERNVLQNVELKQLKDPSSTANL